MRQHWRERALAPWHPAVSMMLASQHYHAEQELRANGVQMTLLRREHYATLLSESQLDRVLARVLARQPPAATSALHEWRRKKERGRQSTETMDQHRASQKLLFLRNSCLLIRHRSFRCYHQVLLPKLDCPRAERKLEATRRTRSPSSGHLIQQRLRFLFFNTRIFPFAGAVLSRHKPFCQTIALQSFVFVSSPTSSP